MQPSKILITVTLTVALVYAGRIGYQVVDYAAETRATLITERTAMASRLAEARAQGFKEGVKSVNISRACTAWWFNTDAKDRHEQAKLAYCKK